MAPKDLRVLPVQYQPDGTRGRSYSDAARQLSETAFPDWKVSGPRATCWLFLSIASQGYTPAQRHYWWRTVQQLTTTDIFVGDHLFLSEILEQALAFDQLNASELCIFELVARRYQLFEEHYDNTFWMDERQLFLGQERGRGKALVAPALESWVA